AGEALPVLETPPARGHAFEFRVNAEDPGRGFLPSGGTVEAVDTPTGPGVRVDSGVHRGTRVATTFDSLLLKLVVSAPTRAQALVRARTALRELRVHGVATTIPFHRAVLDAPAFAGDEELGVWTTWIEDEFAGRLDPDAGYARADQPGRTRFTVDVDGRRMSIGIPDALAAALSAAPVGEAAPAGAEPADDGTVTAPFAGTLVSWLVSEQDTVAAGQDVAVLEAMKTETRVSAPRAGTVRELVASPGDAVAADQVLARLS
ncbi:biotin/lipoyl-containing protein, partial [Kocuria aegyptia]|uniref:biotin/lipoyl-containing protein n=1 Tax=Kocuria aegyptia TaxID=330943 RepID=UPI0031D639E6